MVTYNNITVNLEENSASINGFTVDEETIENLAKIHELIPLAREIYFIYDEIQNEEAAWEVACIADKLMEEKDYSQNYAISLAIDEYTKDNIEIER